MNLLFCVAELRQVQCPSPLSHSLTKIIHGLFKCVFSHHYRYKVILILTQYSELIIHKLYLNFKKLKITFMGKQTYMYND